jgi:hypothetical protein
MTLSDRVKSKKPTQTPLLGRPIELEEEVEEALVKCLEVCADFNYPMRKRQLQDLVQSYCEEQGVKTRWQNNRPGLTWIRKFCKRWSHRVKVKYLGT